MNRIVVASAAGMLFISSSAMALTVTNTDVASTLAAATLAPSSGISIVAGSESLIGSATQQGTFTGFNLGPGTTGTGSNLVLEDGVVLTSGFGLFSTTENTVNSASTNPGTGSFQPLVDLAATGALNTSQNDSNVLSFEFTLDDPTANAVTASFVFATDEFPTQSVTDIMGLFVNGTNFAFFPNGDLVSNQSGDPNDFFNNSPVGTDAITGYGIEWNGLTDVFDVTLLVDAGMTNTIEIAIADTSDTLYDSALFFSNLKSTTVTNGGGGGIGPITPSAVPVPAGLPLLVTGLAGLAFFKRQKKS